MSKSQIILTRIVGIGTTAPGAHLHLKAPTGVNLYLLVSNNDYVAGSAGSGLYLTTNATSGATASMIQALSAGNTVIQPLILNPHASNVGIGTVSPR